MEKFADSHIHYRFMEFDKIKGMLDLIKSIGVTDVCMLSLPYRGVAENLCGLYWKLKYNDMTVRTFGGPHVTDRYCQIPYEEQAEKLLALGCDGIKLMFSPDLRHYVGYGPDHKVYEKMFALLQERGTPINIHCNQPRFYWEDGHIGSECLNFDEGHREMLSMLDKFPKLNVVFAHFMFLSDNPDEAVRIMEKYPNVRFDITPGGEMFVNFTKNPKYWHDFFTKYGNRILFGTDSNSIKVCNKGLNELVYKSLTYSHDEFVQPDVYGRDWHLKGLALSDDVVHRICYQNYIDLVGEVKPVDEEMFYSTCKYVLDDVKNNPVDEFYIKGSALIADFKNDPKQKISTDFLEKVLEEK